MLSMVALGDLPIANNLMLAPLAGYTTLPFRRCMREIGGFGLATTELVHARSLLEGNRRALELVDTEPEDHPLSVQLFGPVAEEVRDAALWLQERGVQAVDVNMGCPVEKVIKIGAGAAMLKDPMRTAEFVKTITRAVNIPVTVKTRLGWDGTQSQAVILAPLLEEVGVSGITIHGRTRQGAFRGTVDLAGIRAVVNSVCDIPVFGNGDVTDLASAREMMDHTGCAGLVIGRGALVDPWIFRRLERGLSGVMSGRRHTLEEHVAFMSRHFDGLVKQRGEKLACTQFRKTIDWYAKCFGPCRLFRLAMKQLSSVSQFHDLVGNFLRLRNREPRAAAAESGFAY